jgi:hypothetical protein
LERAVFFATMSGMGKTGTRFGERFVSFILIAGGILGMIASVQMTAHFAHEHRLSRSVVAVISVPVFAWCILKGADLWRGKPSGYRWARALFLMQIPAVCISRFTYEFSTGMSARILFGHSNRRFGADIGSSLNLLISPEPPGWMLGINIVAVLVTIYLFTVTRHGKRAVDRTTGNAPADASGDGPALDQYSSPSMRGKCYDVE